MSDTDDFFDEDDFFMTEEETLLTETAKEYVSGVQNNILSGKDADVLSQGNECIKQRQNHHGPHKTFTRGSHAKETQDMFDFFGTLGVKKKVRANNAGGRLDTWRSWLVNSDFGMLPEEEDD